MDGVEILQAAYKKISNPHRWTTYALARRWDKKACQPDDPKAHYYCLVGAVDLYWAEPGYTAARQALRKATGSYTIIGVVWKNDNGDHQNALHILEKGIAYLKHRDELEVVTKCQHLWRQHDRRRDTGAVQSVDCDTRSVDAERVGA